MSELYDQIPPERELEYLNQAELTVNEANESLLQNLGVELANQSVMDLEEHQTMHNQLLRSLDTPVESGIVEGTERFLATDPSVAYGLKAPYGSVEDIAHKYPQTHEQVQETMLEIDGLLGMGIDEEVLGLTIQRSSSPSRVNAVGLTEYQVASGQWIDEEAVIDAWDRWGNNAVAHQAAQNYVRMKTIPHE